MDPYPMIEDLQNDKVIAEQLQAQFDEEAAFHTSLTSWSEDDFNDDQNKCNVSVEIVNNIKSVVDPQWETIDPTPNIHALFLEFNKIYFWKKLDGVAVSWSTRMTLCAGVCSYEGRGGLCSIRLSEPLLKLRPRKDLVQTLLHEMIHAYLFVTQNFKDHDAHGPEFHNHMYRINKESGANITVYHSFHDEVDLYRTHWWRCDGPCQKRKPFYGIVRRTMNRAPSARDPWWSEHQRSCGGDFIKIREPEKADKPSSTSKSKPTDTKETKTDNDIRKWISSPSSSSKPTEKSPSKVNNVHTISTVPKEIQKIVPFSGSGHLLGGSTSNARPTHSKNTPTSKPAIRSNGTANSNGDISQYFKKSPKAGTGSGENCSKKTPINKKRAIEELWSSDSDDDVVIIKKVPRKSAQTNSVTSKVAEIKKLPCPVCNSSVMESEINVHLDQCLS